MPQEVAQVAAGVALGCLAALADLAFTLRRPADGPGDFDVPFEGGARGLELRFELRAADLGALRGATALVRRGEFSVGFEDARTLRVGFPDAARVGAATSARAPLAPSAALAPGPWNAVSVALDPHDARGAPPPRTPALELRVTVRGELAYAGPLPGAQLLPARGPLAVLAPPGGVELRNITLVVRDP